MDGARSQMANELARRSQWGESKFPVSVCFILTLSCLWSSSMWSRDSYKSTHCLNSFPFLNPDSQGIDCINIHSSAT